MSKKVQPQKGDQGKHRIEYLDEQNEPYLRALHKKVRNLNKKLTEIAELENKGNLKPEQQDKVNRKKTILEEISKIEDNATFFKEVYAENSAQYRNNQLKELDVLARALVIYQTNTKCQERPKVVALGQALEQKDKHYPSLNEAIAAIGTSLKEFANDWKTQKSLTAFIEESGAKEIKQEVEPVVAKKEKFTEKKVEVKEVKKPEEPKPKAEEPKPKAQPQAVVEDKKPEPVVEKTQKVPEVIVEKESTPIAQATAPKAAEKNEKATEEKKDHKKREYNRDRPNNNYKGNNPRREGDAPRKQYKPKDGQSKPEAEKKDRSESSSSSEDANPQFRKEEIRKLQNDGFQVVGKPKPKVKDNKERKDFHEHQHGKKTHHHHHPNTN